MEDSEEDVRTPAAAAFMTMTTTHAAGRQRRQKPGRRTAARMGYLKATDCVAFVAQSWNAAHGFETTGGPHRCGSCSIGRGAVGRKRLAGSVHQVDVAHDDFWACVSGTAAEIDCNRRDGGSSDIGEGNGAQLDRIALQHMIKPHQIIITNAHIDQCMYACMII